ncbi:calcineurin-like phosphoesterase [Paludibacter jiangxiensis]|uniref:Calcineurin-like phosphoesterase n=2 Tax=Paludibacter jiangxiensis TaxID=681398 RepID=A0A170ZVY2_9BACT|nr:calcineurin-like phosphoesterase [Paludibacter jiangxiensis]
MVHKIMKMRRFIECVALCCLMLLLPLAACQAQFVGGESQQLSGVVLPEKEGMTVKGIVADEAGKPVAGVVVNDGFHFTTTDAAGVYYLPSDLIRSKYVSVSVPAAYRIHASKGVADGYYARLSGGQATNRCDFVLQTRPDRLSAFEYVAMSDPQVRNYTQLDRFQKETVPDLKKTFAQLGNREVYVMTLGDNVWDAMDLFPAYKSAIGSLGVPVFSTIGNHDFNLAYNSLQNSEDPSKPFAEEIYEATFGPVAYSFDLGKIHVVTISDIDYFQDKKYKERVPQDQLEWLKNDLSYVKPGTTVFLNMHAPVLNRTFNGSGNIKNPAELLDILKNYNVHIFTGHTHFYENEEAAPSIYEHNIGAACGAWWVGEVNRCGAPNGYLVVDVNGDSVTWHYKATGQDLSYQFRVYKPGDFQMQPEYLVANVWDWDPAWKVQYYENGELRGAMEQFADEDQAFIDMKKGKPEGYKTAHLFRIKPTKGVKYIKIEVVNRFGEVYDKNIKL